MAKLMARQIVLEEQERWGRQRRTDAYSIHATTLLPCWVYFK